jgi:hypothetical protein
LRKTELWKVNECTWCKQSVYNTWQMEGQSIKLFGKTNSKTNCQIVEFLALMWFLGNFWKVKMKYTMYMQNILKTFPI